MDEGNQVVLGVHISLHVNNMRTFGRSVVGFNRDPA